MNTTELAACLGCSRPTISKWVDQGAPCASRGRKGVSAEFDAPAFIAWWRENVVAAAEQQPDSLHDRELLIDIRIKEERLAQLRASLVPKAAGVAVVNAMLGAMSAHMRRAPQRVAPRLVGLQDMATALAVMTEIAEEQLAELRRPDLWRSLEVLVFPESHGAGEPAEQRALL